MDRRIKVQPVNQVLKIQVGLLVLIGTSFLVFQGVEAAIAGCFGGLITTLNTLLQRWHLIRAAKTAKSDASMNLSKAYRCIAERWFLTICMFSVAFAVLELSVLPLMIGFITLQAALLFGFLNRV
jgi:ATP synthase protein I